MVITRRSVSSSILRFDHVDVLEFVDLEFGGARGKEKHIVDLVGLGGKLHFDSDVANAWNGAHGTKRARSNLECPNIKAGCPFFGCDVPAMCSDIVIERFQDFVVFLYIILPRKSGWSGDVGIISPFTFNVR